MWHDILEAVYPSGHLHPEFIRNVTSGFVNWAFLGAIGAVLVSRFRDIAQFGQERYEIANTFFDIQRSLFEIVVEPETGYRRGLPGIRENLQTQLGSANKMIEMIVSSKKSLSQTHMRSVKGYKDSLSAFAKSIADGTNWNTKKQNSFNASSDALAALMRKLVRGKGGKVLQAAALELKIRGNNETDTPATPTGTETIGQMIAQYRTASYLSRVG